MRSDSRLRALGFNPHDVREYHYQKKKHARLTKELEAANTAEDWDKVFPLEDEIRKIGLTLKYQGEDPKSIPLADIRLMLEPALSDDAVVIAAKRKVRNPGTAIRAFCLWCMGGSAHDVKRCQAVQCPLWSMRTGKNPFFGKKVPKAEELILEDDDLVDIEEDSEDEVADADT